MSFENPGDGKRCDHCNRSGELYANLGERLCLGCLTASVDADLRENGLRVIQDGRETTYRLGYITPRSAR